MIALNSNRSIIAGLSFKSRPPRVLLCFVWVLMSKFHFIFNNRLVLHLHFKNPILKNSFRNRVLI